MSNVIPVILNIENIFGIVGFMEVSMAMAISASRFNGATVPVKKPDVVRIYVLP